MKRLVALTTAVAVVASLGVTGTMTASADAAPQVLTVNGQDSGRTFDGVGGLSAGASSRMLIDYPSKPRSQILDYLFKPDYGASMQILKAEIGGDTNSTDGTEPSHERAPGQVDCNGGYEWWLMKQAKARNPGIKLYGLEWGTPGWVGAGTNTVWTDQNLAYLLDWLGCARRHGLTIDYLGGWNEKGFRADWYVKLRQALDAHGYSDVQIAAADDPRGGRWRVADALAADPQFAAAVDVVATHDPCLDSPTLSCPSTPTAQALGEPLWNSEQGAQVYNVDAPRLAQELNRDYIDGRVTSLIAWSLIWSVYASLPLQGTGMMLANTPWSGHYDVDNSMIWAMAHTAQFAQPGWRYLDGASTRLGGGGSVVSLRSPDTKDWSSIVETADASAPQPVTFQLRGGLSTGTVHVWATNLNSTDPNDWFRRTVDVQPHDGSFSMTFEPGYIYSLTTTTGQHKGTAVPPPTRPWRLPYSEGFDGYPAGATPRLFADVGGSFQTAPCASRAGMCLQQEVAEQPVRWTSINNYPLTVVGDPTSWRDYRVGVDARLDQPGYVELDGRSPATEGRSQGFFSSPPGYHFRVDDRGAWSLFKQDVASHTTMLASGTARFGVAAWHRLGLELRGNEITASLDGKALATALDATYRVGQVGLQVSPWDQAQFDNVQVQAVPAAGQGPELGPVRPDPVELATPGDSAQVSTTVTNPGRLPATAIDAELQPPAGWTATAVTPPPTRLLGGRSAPLSWQLASPASAAPGLYHAMITVTYQEGGSRWIAATSVAVDLSVVPHSQMSATATSWQPGFEPGLAIDDATNTFWHTAFSPVKDVPPQSITLDLGASYDVSGLLYLPRQDGNPNGTITAYNVYASSDGTSFTQVASGTWTDDATRKSAALTANGARFIRLEGVRAHNDNVSAAEINVVATPVR